jgi:hypothetical protein
MRVRACGHRISLDWYLIGNDWIYKFAVVGMRLLIDTVAVEQIVQFGTVEIVIDGLQSLSDNELVQLDGIGHLAGLLAIVVDEGFEEPRASQRKVHTRTTPMPKVRIQQVGNVFHVNVNVEQLGQIEVDVLIGKREQPVDEICLHARLLRIVYVTDGYGHVEMLRLEESEQP